MTPKQHKDIIDELERIKTYTSNTDNSMFISNILNLLQLFALAGILYGIAL